MIKFILFVLLAIAYSEADLFDSLRVPKSEPDSDDSNEDPEPDYVDESTNGTNLLEEAWERAQQKCYPLSDPLVLTVAILIIAIVLLCFICACTVYTVCCGCTPQCVAARNDRRQGRGAGWEDDKIGSIYAIPRATTADPESAKSSCWSRCCGKTESADLPLTNFGRLSVTSGPRGRTVCTVEPHTSSTTDPGLPPPPEETLPLPPAPSSTTGTVIEGPLQ